jgi:hypothetical protein
MVFVIAFEDNLEIFKAETIWLLGVLHCLFNLTNHGCVHLKNLLKVCYWGKSPVN